MGELKNLTDAALVDIERQARRRADKVALALSRGSPLLDQRHLDAANKYLAYVAQERQRRGLQPSAIV